MRQYSKDRCLGLPDGRSRKRPTCLCAPDFRIGVGTFLEMPGSSALLRFYFLRSDSGSLAALSRQIQSWRWQNGPWTRCAEHRASERCRLARPPAFGVDNRHQAAQGNAQARSGIFAFDHRPTNREPRPLSLSGRVAVASQLRRTVDVDRRRRGSETRSLRTLQLREHGKTR